MPRWWRSRDGTDRTSGRLRTDGGGPDDHEGVDDEPGRPDEGTAAEEGDDDPSDEDADAGAADDPDRADVEVMDAGEAEPATPEWDRPDPEDIPEFEVRADQPVAGGSATTGSAGSPDADDDPTAGRPNTARSPGRSRIRREGTDGYLAALELCARLPDDVRLPEQAADLVPAAVEAELEEDVRSFAAAEFDEPTPTVDTLSFEEVEGEVWLRIRLGAPPAAFADLDPDVIRRDALEELEGLF